MVRKMGFTQIALHGVLALRSDQKIDRPCHPQLDTDPEFESVPNSSHGWPPGQSLVSHDPITPLTSETTPSAAAIFFLET